MGKKDRARRARGYGRDTPAGSPRSGARPGGEIPGSSAVITTGDWWRVLCKDGYRPLVECPEVQMCIGVYADLISSMTIHLMANAEGGDVRVKNQLSRKLDIEPARDMTRMTFIQTIVRTLLGAGDGNQITIPRYNREGLLEDLRPIPPQMVSFDPVGESYEIIVNGIRYRPDEVLHFVINPDVAMPWRGAGFKVSLRDVVGSLRQANATRDALMQSPAPSLIVKVDGLTEEFSSPEGRKRLGAQYYDSTEAGQPWFIPAEAFSVEQVKPMTISDLAIDKNLDLDRRSIAAIFGVPAYMVGVGEFNLAEYQHFLSTRVMAVAKEIEQELTKKLLISPDMYWRFSARSLYNYSIGDMVAAGSEMVDRMAMRRNEWRDWMGLPPDPEMNELLALENYIPADRLGDQGKLTGGDKDG